ncbi:xibalbin-1-like [Tachypleus tridentatus]|uniref:xibalbin-1-like n=1 Tax=Tachypleus tridentatus TaxID=6853 RepID=UPI003FD67521
MNYFVIAVIFGLLQLHLAVTSSSYSTSGDELEKYREKLQELLLFVYRRTCVPRGKSCDARPNSCCGGSSCRCNLWGTNCRCQRQGIFQGWGK